MAAASFVPPPDFVAEHGYLSEYEPRGGDTPEMADVVAEGSPDAHSVDVVRGAALPGVKPTSTTVAAAFAQYGLSPLLQMALLAAFECGEEDSAEAMSSTPDEEITEILGEITLGDEMRAPTRLEKGHVRTFFKKLRESFSSPPPRSTLPSSSAAAPIVVQLPDTTGRHEFRDYIDQTAKGTFTELGPKEMSELRGRHEKYTGTPVSGDARPSDLQLSALAHWIREQSNGRMNAPFVEFATWGGL